MTHGSLRGGIVCCVLALVSALVGCASTTLPRAQEALYTDLAIIVETRQRSQWVADRLEIEAASNLALRSVCRTPLETHRALSRWLEREITRLGGPSRARFIKQGRRLKGLSHLMREERIYGLLKHTMAIRAKDCPFWLRPSATFSGVHQNSYRFTLMGESMGGGTLFLRDKQVAVGGGGALRLLTAFGLSQRWTLAVGVELGGQGRFTPDGTGGQELSADLNLAGSVLFRYQRFSQLVDIGLAVTHYFDDEGFDHAPGARVAIGYGIATPRLGKFMPYAMLYVGYEIYPGRAIDPITHVFRIGTRVGVSFDP